MKHLSIFLLAVAGFAQTVTPPSGGGAGGGSGDVTASGSITTNAIVTAAGATSVKTICAGCTLDAAGLLSITSIATGAGAGAAGSASFLEGTAPTPAANTVTLYAPTSVSTAYKIIFPAAAATGIRLWTNSSNTVTESVLSTTGTGDVVRGTSPTITGLTSVVFATGNNVRAGGFGATFNGGGSALTAGTTVGTQLVYMVVPYACTVLSWDITVDAGTAGFRVWRIATGTAVPTVANTITSVGDLAIASGTALHSTTATNWSGGAFPTIAANDIVAIHINAVATATFATFGVQCQK